MKGCRLTVLMYQDNSLDYGKRNSRSSMFRIVPKFKKEKAVKKSSPQSGILCTLFLPHWAENSNLLRNETQWGSNFRQIERVSTDAALLHSLLQLRLFQCSDNWLGNRTIWWRSFLFECHIHAWSRWFKNKGVCLRFYISVWVINSACLHSDPFMLSSGCQRASGTSK